MEYPDAIYTPRRQLRKHLGGKSKGSVQSKWGGGGFELPQSECVKLVEATRNAIGDDMDIDA